MGVRMLLQWQDTRSASELVAEHLVHLQGVPVGTVSRRVVRYRKRNAENPSGRAGALGQKLLTGHAQLEFWRVMLGNGGVAAASDGDFIMGAEVVAAADDAFTGILRQGPSGTDKYEERGVTDLSGNRYAVGDFTVCVLEMVQGGSSKGYVVEVEYLPCSDPLGGQEVLEAFVLLVTPDGAQPMTRLDEGYLQTPLAARLPSVYSPAHHALQVFQAARATAMGNAGAAANSVGANDAAGAGAAAAAGSNGVRVA